MTDWLRALEARHLANLRVPELTRALRALSSAYVERRHTIARGAALDTAGKRAAFALFYAPLHFMTVNHVVRAIGADRAPLSSILDIGCGTGAAGAAWALTVGRDLPILGIDRHPWAIEEARRTYRHFGLKGQVRRGDASRLPVLRGTTGIIAAYFLNELPETSRQALFEQLLTAARTGARLLVLEPIARGAVPWWDAASSAIVAAGGRADTWRFAVELPEILRRFDRAAGLNHSELKVRSLFL